VNNTEQHRHRCEVRHLLKLQAEQGTEPVSQYLGGLKKRGAAAVQRLRHDGKEQWSRGNRGAWGDWR